MIEHFLEKQLPYIQIYYLLIHINNSITMLS